MRMELKIEVREVSGEFTLNTKKLKYNKEHKAWFNIAIHNHNSSTED